MRPEGLEPPAFWSVARRSIQLSYGRISLLNAHDRTRTCTPSPALVPQTSLSTNFSTWAEYRANEVTTVRCAERSGMLEEGLEPSRGHPHRVLNPARLPIPPPEPCSSHHDGAEGNRTPDLLNAIQALSQLSYGPLTGPAKPGPARAPDSDLSINDTAGLTGLEPATSGVTDRHSNQLSYSPQTLQVRRPDGESNPGSHLERVVS